ncbi:MAG: methyltransferase domain-containing protein [Dehalococcoidia bacterium]|nr:methyltransferase domain-containing protein [Dehalococcoidia bacterium]
MNIVIRELARFLEIGEDEARHRIKHYHPDQLGEEWKKAAPSNPEEVENFYRKTDKYLCDLILWNHTEEFHRRSQPLMYYRNKRILEIGAGNGSLCIALAMNGNEVTYYDINEKLFVFAAQRFADRLLPIKMIKDLKGERDYDIVVAIDTLEHIHPDALPKFLKDISHCLRDGGFLYHRSQFTQQEGLFPMHYDHSKILPKLAEDAGLAPRSNGDYIKGTSTGGVQISIPLRDDQHSVGLTQNLISLDLPPMTNLLTCTKHSVDYARNLLAKKLDRDWLFFMDADQSFPNDVLQRLMSWNLDIISGIVFQRGGEPIPMVYKYIMEGEGGGNYYMPLVKELKEYLDMQKVELEGAKQAICLPPYGVLEVDGVSAGCLLIHRRVFDELEEPYFKCNDNTSCGEDFYFCRKAQAAGFKIFADPSVMCGHLSQYERGWKHFLAWANKDQFPWDKDPGQVHGSRDEKV